MHHRARSSVKVYGVIACAILCAPTLGVVTTNTFEEGTNFGQWQFYNFAATPLTPQNGNPGWQLRQMLCCDIAAPWVQTVDASVFTGNYRARNVLALQTDVRIYTIEMDGLVPITHLSLRLETDAGTPGDSSDDFAAYFAGGEDHKLPLDDSIELWKTIEFDVDSQSPTLPAGWIFVPIDRLAGGSAPVSANWVALMEHVTAISFEFGPEFWAWPVLLFDIGVDNLSIKELPLCTGDVNADTQVDVFDLLAVLSAFGTSAGDINGDSLTDVFDLLDLLENWGSCNT